MNPAHKTQITVSATIEASINRVWEYWNSPEHVTKWNQASEDWHSPHARNDFREGGDFSYRMEAKDGSMGFDFAGTYLKIKPYELINFVLEDGRAVSVRFEPHEDGTYVEETFEAENEFPVEMQQEGWQSILHNFKKYTEAKLPLKPLFISITINAPVEKVYLCMLDDAHYREWTSVFYEGSYFVGDWKKGTKILFLATDEKGDASGMVSRIEENIPNRMVFIEHLGMVGNGQEITDGPEVEVWKGAMENYFFKEKDGQTEVIVTLDTDEKYLQHFEETWPKALQRLKDICERG